MNAQWLGDPPSAGIISSQTQVSKTCNFPCRTPKRSPSCDRYEQLSELTCLLFFCFFLPFRGQNETSCESWWHRRNGVLTETAGQLGQLSSSVCIFYGPEKQHITSLGRAVKTTLVHSSSRGSKGAENEPLNRQNDAEIVEIQTTYPTSRRNSKKLVSPLTKCGNALLWPGQLLSAA